MKPDTIQILLLRLKDRACLIKNTTDYIQGIMRMIVSLLIFLFLTSVLGQDLSTSPLVILGQQATNVIAWTLAPLDQEIPNGIRQNLLSLREDIVDEGKTSPITAIEAYRSAYRLCSGLIGALDERQKALVKAGVSSAMAESNASISTQALEARRNYLMNWPQYSRELDQRNALQKQTQNKLALIKELPKLDWSAKLNRLRPSIDNLYVNFRDALRQDGALISLIASTTKETTLQERDLISGSKSIHMTGGNIAVIRANSPQGASLGTVKEGDTLTLEYVSGKWKAFGRYATSNPDEPTPGIGADDNDRSRLAIATAPVDGRPGEMIAIVPGGTASKPFVFVFTKQYNDVCLRIASNSDNASNPGEVVYRYRLDRR